MVRQGDELARRLGPGANPLANTVDPTHQAAVKLRIVAQVIKNPLPALNQARQNFIDIANRKGIVSIMILNGPIGACPVTVPDLHGAVAFTTEQHVLAMLTAGQQDQHRLGLRKAGEIPEITVLSVGVFHIPVTGALRGGR